MEEFVRLLCSWNCSCRGHTGWLHNGSIIRVYSTGLLYGSILRVLSTGSLYGFSLRVLSTGSLYGFSLRVLFEGSLFGSFFGLFLGTTVLIILSIYMGQLTLKLTIIKQFNLFYAAHISLLYL
jgi:hypothetical protein